MSWLAGVGPRSILAVNTDVTEQRRMEAQFLRAQRSESIGTLARGIAHDLNNLLAPIVTGAALLRMSDRDEATTEIIDAMEVSARRGTALVRQVLSFTRGVDGARVQVRLADVVDELVSIAATAFPKSITVRPAIAVDLWEVQGDPTQLHQVLLNLLVNARDALPQGGHIDIRAKNVDVGEGASIRGEALAPGRHVLLEVVDDGVGMDADLKERIFEPFLTTKDLGDGTGLGLSTVLAIVRSHGGVIDVSSQPGRGSTFGIYLPVQGEVDPDRSEHGRPPAQAGADELILVVDDEAAITRMLGRVLSAHGYRVLTAADGAEAMRVFAMHQDEIAAVFTDLGMPVLDGAGLIAGLRTIDPAVPIVATSGGLHDASDVVVPGPPVHFLPKPSPPEQVLERLATAIASRGRA